MPFNEKKSLKFCEICNTKMRKMHKSSAKIYKNFHFHYVLLSRMLIFGGTEQSSVYDIRQCRISYIVYRI